MPTESERIIVDARMLFSSGIGRYLREILSRRPPSLLPKLIIGLGDVQAQEWCADCMQGCEVLPTNEQVYGLRELFGVRCHSDGRVLWVPHYNIPLNVRIPIVVTVHDVAHLALPDVFRGGIKRVYAKLMFRYVRKRADKILFVSNFTDREFRSLVGHPNGLSRIVYNGVSEYWRAPGGERSARPGVRTLLAVGNIKPHKNIVRLLSAIRAKGQAGLWRLIVVGEVSGFITGESISSEAVGPWVTFAGRIDDTKLRELYRTVDAFIMPSLYEGFGLPVLEAMSAGCPVVVSMGGSLEEIAGGPDAQLADFFEPRETSSIEAAILRSLERAIPEREARLQRARTWASLFNWSVAAQSTWDSIKEQFVRPPLRMNK